MALTVLIFSEGFEYDQKDLNINLKGLQIMTAVCHLLSEKSHRNTPTVLLGKVNLSLKHNDSIIRRILSRKSNLDLGLPQHET